MTKRDFVVRHVRRRCDVKTPSEKTTLDKTIKVAEGRTRTMVLHWASGDYKLSTLAVSCYMQGLNDMVDFVEAIRQYRGFNPEYGASERCSD